ncbi:MAG TPA: hypothetical protein EYP19_12690, partial [Desulfobacterales bacterium]|nr:hypothetical protein [Desulfobacterales bacterium]
MSKPISFGKLDFKLVSSMDGPLGVPEPETPFRIAILGDFSGRENRGVSDSILEPGDRRPLFVDRDDLNEVLAKLGVEIHLPIGDNAGASISIPFSELDGFHPDKIYEELEVFRSLRETRRKLDDPGTFAATAAEMG